MISLLPPFWLIRVAVAAVWLYEGLWCKLLGGAPDQTRIVQSVPCFGPRFGQLVLGAIGVIEVALALWVLNGAAPILCATAQTLLLVTMNANGLLWARNLINDPGGMIVKNFAFIVLAWVAASLPG